MGVLVLGEIYREIKNIGPEILYRASNNYRERISTRDISTTRKKIAMKLSL